MRRQTVSSPQPPANQGTRNDWATLKTLIPYLWAYKWRVSLALVFLVGAKVANVTVPLVLKKLIDGLTIKPGDPQALLVLPLGLLIAYGALRLSTTLFTELREFVFARVTQRAVRTIALKVFRHLHALSLRFHLTRQTGGMTRDIERGTRGISSLVSYTLFSILPTLVEIALVLGYLITHYNGTFAAITGAALLFYIGFTVSVTEWRTQFRRTMNDLDSKANTKAIDSLLNYETVKYFSAEARESARYDRSMAR
ncbi:MAG TPA: ABC transporter transmembrane domain-containing protein, partial [Burkholderiaceae bacterium]